MKSTRLDRAAAKQDVVDRVRSRIIVRANPFEGIVSMYATHPRASGEYYDEVLGKPENRDL